MILVWIFFSSRCVEITEDQDSIHQNGEDFIVTIQDSYSKLKLPDEFLTLVKEKDLNSPKLVFRFNEVTCGTCISIDIRILREFAEKIGWDNIIFLATNNDQIFLDRFEKISKIKTKIYNIENNYFIVDKELFDTPYMFILDTNNIYKDLFISKRGEQYRTRQYFEYILQNHFNESINTSPSSTM